MASLTSVPAEVIRISGRRVVELLKAGELSAREVLESYIERITEINPLLNALVVPFFDQARRDAAALDAAYMGGDQLGPLHGLQITAKESVEVAGTPSTLGLTARISDRATADAPQVVALKHAGAVLVGKTNASLFLRAYETDNPVYRLTNNP